MHSSDRQEDVARIKGTGRACASGGSLYTLVIKEQQQGFPFYAFKAEINISRETLFGVTVERRMRDLLQTGDQLVSPCFEMFRVLINVCSRFLTYSIAFTNR